LFFILTGVGLGASADGCQGIRYRTNERISTFQVLPATSEFNRLCHFAYILRYSQKVCVFSLVCVCYRVIILMGFIMDLVGLCFVFCPSVAHKLVAWCSSNAFHPINEVTLHQARLVLGWVTFWGQVNHLGI